MTSNLFYILIFLASINILIMTFRQNNNSCIKPTVEKAADENKACIDYQRKCNQLFIKLRYPNQSLIIRPPPQMPPDDLMNRFTQNGDMPITKNWYFNEVYSDSNSNSKNVQEIITTFQFRI